MKSVINDTKAYTEAEESPFGEPDHIPHSEMERRFDEQSKENYERIDREAMKALEETDKILTASARKCGRLLPSERRKVRELINWQERFLVWIMRITFMLFLYAYWYVEHPKCLAAQEKVKALEERVEQLNEMFNPTEAPEEK